MSEHTKEPWNIRYSPNGDGCFITAAKEGKMPYAPEIMGDDYTGYGDDERRGADALRIVACVNACAGMKDPAVSIVTLKAQRDELLAAAKSMIACHDEDIDMDEFEDDESVGSEIDDTGAIVDMPMTFGMLRRLRAAIANAERSEG